MAKNNYEEVIKIRAFEELILDLFGKNKLSGTTHTYIGEEATAVALMNHVTENDFIFSNHRCHGHYLAYGGPEKKLLAEIMSKESGLCQGKGGSQHIHYKHFYTNGIQGGIVPNATGIAFANKLKGNQANTFVFLGDGTLGQGVVYESLNVASVYDIPIVYVIEDNTYAMSTKRTDVIAGDIKARIEGFNIKTYEIESTDVDELDTFFSEAIDQINIERKPICAIVHNYRLSAHSKGDDTRDPEEIRKYKEKDPIKLIKEKIGEDKVNSIYQEYQKRLVSFVEELEQEDSITISVPELSLIKNQESFLPKEEKRYVDLIRVAFEDQLKLRKNIVFMGEDLRDPYGGPFKATKGLSTIFDKQIINMPISEACMVGLSVGLAMNGVMSVTEMMFGDFITLGFDQLLNHASKYGWVYGINIPMIVRIPSGAKRGYGPTHSQSLEKYLVGIPGIRVLALSAIIDPKKIYELIFDTISEPTIVIENKKLYGTKTWKVQNNRYGDFEVKEYSNYGYSTIKLSIDLENTPDVYIITYGGMIEDSVQAADELMIKDEIQADVIILSQLSPVPIIDLEEGMCSNVPVIIVEEGTLTGGIGAELIARCVEGNISKNFYRVATPDMPIPNGIALEEQIIPDKNSIISKVKEILQ